MENKAVATGRQEICIICTTAPPSHAAALARSLIEKNLVACVNITPVRSLYRWKGEFCDEEEHLLVIKTRRELVQTVMQAIREEHPYEVPEIIALPVTEGYPPYLEWVFEETVNCAGRE